MVRASDSRRWRWRAAVAALALALAGCGRSASLLPTRVLAPRALRGLAAPPAVLAHPAAVAATSLVAWTAAPPESASAVVVAVTAADIRIDGARLAADRLRAAIAARRQAGAHRVIVEFDAGAPYQRLTDAVHAAYAAGTARDDVELRPIP